MRTRLGRKEKKNRTALVFPLFIVFIMVISVIGFSFGGSNESSQQNYEYNGYEFELDKENQILTTNIYGKDFGFYNLPQDVLGLEVNGSIGYSSYSWAEEEANNQVVPYSKQMITYTLNSIGKVVEEPLGITYNEASVSCADATPEKAVLKFEESSDSVGIFNEDNCIILRGSTDQDFIMLKDRFMYNLLGIIQ